MRAATIFWTALLAILPISELRGAIPLAMARGIPWYIAYPFAAAMNALVAPVCWIFLSTLHRLFIRLAEPAPDNSGQNSEQSSKQGHSTPGRKSFFAWYKRFFDSFVERARKKLHRGVEKWGWLGIALFVAVPLPITGAWTGTLGAWVLGLSKRKTMLAVILGVIAAGAVVTAVVLLGIQALDLFVKKIRL